MTAPPGRAATLLREAELVHVLVVPDADSVLAAGLLGVALERAKVPWHARPASTLDAEAFAPLLEEGPGQPVVLCGLGARDDGALDAAGLDAVVLDASHPRAPSKRALLLEDPAPGATAATLAFDLARALDGRASALPALAGLDALGPRPDAEGLRARLRAEAAAGGILDGPVPALGAGSLVEAIAGTTSPYLPGLSGRARATKRFLESLALRPEAAAAELSLEDARRLADALVLHLLARGAPGHAAAALLVPDARPPAGLAARALARRCGAAALAGRPGLALALALGDPRAEPEALALDEAREQRLLQTLLKLEGDAAAGAGPLRADPDLAGDLAWACSLALRGGEPVAAVGEPGRLHVAAPLAEPRFLGQAALGAAQAAGGAGRAWGHRAILDVPAGQGPVAWEHLRRSLGVVG